MAVGNMHLAIEYHQVSANAFQCCKNGLLLLNPGTADAEQKTKFFVLAFIGENKKLSGCAARPSSGFLLFFGDVMMLHLFVNFKSKDNVSFYKRLRWHSENLAS